jgi:hypothetical protein
MRTRLPLIDVTPLRAFDGEEEDVLEGDAVEGDGEEGDEVEIEEEVFDSSQPTQHTRTMNYTKVEDACLAKTWKSVPLDAVSGNDQTGKRYWQRIEHKFGYIMP